MALSWYEPSKETQPATRVGWLAKDNVFTLLPGLHEKLPGHRHDMLISAVRPF